MQRAPKLEKPGCLFFRLNKFVRAKLELSVINVTVSLKVKQYTLCCGHCRTLSKCLASEAAVKYE
jgi:hypothetical protein